MYEFQEVLAEKTGKEIHRAYQNPDIGQFTELSELRGKLITEEAKELEDALNNENHAQVLKELCDLLYVIYGTAVVYGIRPEVILNAFRKVHANNMAKILHGTLDERGKLIKPKDHPKVDLSEEVDSWLSRYRSIGYVK